MSRRTRSIVIRVGVGLVVVATVFVIDLASWMATGSAPLAIRLRGGEYAGALGPGFTINESFCFGTVSTCAAHARHVWTTVEPLTLLASVALLVVVTYAATALWSLRRR